MQDKMNEVLVKVQKLVAKAKMIYGIQMPEVNIHFDLTGRSMAMACYNRKNGFHIRINAGHMALGGKTYEHIINDTLPHEVAHIVCFAHPRLGNIHDKGWKMVCINLGGNGERCYSAANAPEAAAVNKPRVRRVKTIVYTATDGTAIPVTKTIHNRIQRGSQYRTKLGGVINMHCNFKETKV